MFSRKRDKWSSGKVNATMGILGAIATTVAIIAGNYAEAMVGTILTFANGISVVLIRRN